MDDYAGGHPGDHPLHMPTLCVDTFATLWAGQYTCLHQGYQAHFQKNRTDFKGTFYDSTRKC